MTAPQPPLVRLLSAAASQLSDRMLAAQHAAGFSDIRPAHGAVFGNLPAEGTTLTELARRAGMTKQAMAELVKDLEALGYVQRRVDPTDRRAQIIEFTPRGWRSVRLALKTFDDHEQTLSQLIGTRRLQELRATLEKLLQN